jgi:hypothetical protein
MRHEVYAGIKVTSDFSVFDFTSIGRNGAIAKRIAFTGTEWDKVYNLAFGDIDVNGEMDFYSISDNGDKNKILATIAKVIGDYTKQFPDRLILFTGSTEERTRLYRMAVGMHLEELSNTFEIYAFVDKAIVPFTKNMKINAFLVKRKNI